MGVEINMTVKNYNEVYKILVDYLVSKCNFISVTKYIYPKLNVLENTINVILRETNQTKQEFIDKIFDESNEEYINDLINKFIYNKEIFNRDCKNLCGAVKGNSKISISQRVSFIISCIDEVIYGITTEKWIKKYKNNIILKNEIDGDFIYFLKLN